MSKKCSRPRVLAGGRLDALDASTLHSRMVSPTSAASESDQEICGRRRARWLSARTISYMGRITTEDYGALRTVLPFTFWFKDNFGRFMKTVGRVRPELLEGICFSPRVTASNHHPGKLIQK